MEHLPQQVKQSPKFQAWYEKVLQKFYVDELNVAAYNMFGPNLGFAYIQAEVRCKKTGKKVPGITFLRGPSVAALIVVEVVDWLNDNGKPRELVLLTKQARLPVGDDGFVAAPAGMVDNEGNLAGAMMREIEEETGIKVSTKDEAVQNLGSFFPSEGGCDEEITLFHVRVKKTKAEVDAMKVATFGLEEEGEDISLCFVPLFELEEQFKTGQIKDAKLGMAYLYYLIRA